MKTFLQHIFSWHALMIVLGQATTITALDPSMAQYHALLIAIGSVITALGAIKASLFKTTEEKTAIKAARSVVNSAAIALILIPAFFMTACLPKPSQCLPPVPAALVQKCTLEQNLIACGETDIGSLVPVLMEIIAEVVASAFNPATLVTALVGQGVKDIPCVITALEDYFGENGLNSPQMVAKLDAALKIAVAQKGLHGSVTIKLKNGHTKTVVVQ